MAQVYNFTNALANSLNKVSGKYPPIAINISFTFIDVLADVSMKSKLLSSA